MTAGTPKPQVDTSRPNPARVYDYLLGGKDSYPVDQEVGRQMPAEAKEGVKANRAFMHRAIGWVARSGVDQFLDIGTGIPTAPNLHQIAQAVNPKARVLCTDNDPIVLRHAEALLVSTPEGATAYTEADAREPGRILDHARTVLDFDRPVALSLVALMHFVPDEDEAYGIVGTLVDALAPGSYLVLSHFTDDGLPQKLNKVAEYRSSGIELQPRGRAEVAGFFRGLDLVGPGFVTPRQWYGGTPVPGGSAVEGFYVGVARVPDRSRPLQCRVDQPLPAKELGVHPAEG